MYLPILLLSFLGTNGTMFYILFRHRHDRKSSVSLHAAINNHSHATFALGHFIGGLAFLYFAYKFFYVDNEQPLLFIFSAFGVFFEQVQAMLPNKNAFVKIHTVSAAMMALSMVLLIAAAPFVLDIKPSLLIIYITLIFVLVLAGIYALIKNDKFYQTQMVFFFMFYPFLIIMLSSTK